MSASSVPRLSLCMWAFRPRPVGRGGPRTVWRDGLQGGAGRRGQLPHPPGAARRESLPRLCPARRSWDRGVRSRRQVYPSCGYTHRSIDCAVELHRVTRHRVGGGGGERDRVLAGLSSRHPALGVPKDRTEALFSTAYASRWGSHRANRVADFSDEAVRREDILALAGSVEVSARKPRGPNSTSTRGPGPG